MSTLLETLRADRKKCKHLPTPIGPGHCDNCGIEWPCPTARALDCAIAGVEACEDLAGWLETHAYHPAETCIGPKNMRLIAREALAAMSRAYFGEKVEEREDA